MTDLVNQCHSATPEGVNQCHSATPEGVNQCHSATPEGGHRDRGYIYVASPYSSSSAAIREQRFQAVLSYVMRGLGAGELLLSPIVYGHQMAILGLSGGFSFWKRFDASLIDGSCGVRVLKLPGWEASVGVKWEIDYALNSGHGRKEVAYIEYWP